MRIIKESMVEQCSRGIENSLFWDSLQLPEFVQLIFSNRERFEIENRYAIILSNRSLDFTGFFRFSRQFSPVRNRRKFENQFLAVCGKTVETDSSTRTVETVRASAPSGVQNENRNSLSGVIFPRTLGLGILGLALEIQVCVPTSRSISF